MTMSMLRAEIEQWLIGQLREVVASDSLAVSQLKDWRDASQRSPRDLGMDSTLLMDLAARIEDQFDVIVTSDFLASDVPLQAVLDKLSAGEASLQAAKTA